MDGARAAARKDAEPVAPRRSAVPEPSPGVALPEALPHRLSGLFVRLKPRTGAPNDTEEREAGEWADAVLSAPVAGGVLRRKCAACEDEDKNVIRQKGRISAPVRSEAPDSAHQILREPGRPLDAATRAFFEPRFGADFSHVRVHAGARAARAADELGARAFAAGPHIAFAADEYAPHSDGGKRLLAHELAHVLYDGSGAVARCEPDEASPSLWERSKAGLTEISGAVVAGAANAGQAILQGAGNIAGAVASGVGAAGTTILKDAVATAGGVAEGVTNEVVQIAAFHEKLARLSAVLAEYAPLPDGLIRLKDQMIAEEARLLALGARFPAAAVNAFPLSMPPSLPRTPGGGAGGGASGEPAGGCGLCYGNEPGGIGPREAGSAAHKVIQNLMIADFGVTAELPLGGGRVDLAVVRPASREIVIGEIKPANERGMDAGIDQIEARLRAVAAMSPYAGYTAVPMSYPVRQPIRFETMAPVCLEQPGFCYSQDMAVAGPVGGLYMYFCEPSYSELLSGGCSCRCRERRPYPFPFPVWEGKRGKAPDSPNLAPEPAINWAKVAAITMIIAMAIAVVAAVVCAFAGTATVVGIPVAAICAVAGLAAATAMIALIAKVRSEPDTTA